MSFIKLININSIKMRLVKNYKLMGALVLMGAAMLSCSGLKNSSTIKDDAWVYEGIEFDMPKVKEPAIPNNSINIANLGGVPDGKTLNTDVFAKAIEQLTAKGGGKVIIPAGIWLTGPIQMKSNIELHVEDGALVRFSGDFDLYPLIATSFEGLETYRSMSPIHAHNLENIAFTGNGTFDGTGDAWRPVKKGKMTAGQWKNLLNSGGVVNKKGDIWYPTENSMRGDSRDNFNVPDFTSREEFEQVKDFLRPVMVSIVNSQRVLLDGPTFQNSPAWNIHPLMCEDVTIRNLTVRNPWYSQNGDGLDLESCKNVVIYNNSFDVGDDAICFKSGKDEDGRKRNIPTENVIVKNNVVYHGHGGFVVGSEMSGGVRNVHISSCTFMGTDIGLRFKSTRGRGGIVENIYISNINMIDIPAEPIRFNLFYGGKSPVLDDGGNSLSTAGDAEAMPVTEETPSFRNIYMKNIVANGLDKAAFFMGLPEMKVENIRLENAILRAPKGITMVDTKGIQFVNVRVEAEEGPAVIIYNSSDISLDGFEYKDNSTPVVLIGGGQTSHIKVKSTDFSEIKSQIKLAEELDAATLSVE